MRFSKTILKKSVSLLVSAAMLISTPVVYAEEQDSYSATELTYSAEGTDLGVTDDELLLGYFENKLYGIEGGISTFGSLNTGRLTESERTVYEEFLGYAKAIAAGERSSTVFTSTNEIVYTYEELGITIDETLSDTDMKAKIQKAVQDKYYSISPVIHNYLVSDNPYEFYWYDKTQSMTRSALNIKYGYTTVNNVVQYSNTASFSIQFTYVPGVDYAASSANTVDTTKTAATSKAAENALAIVEAAKDMSDYEKLVYYKEQICSLVEYNDDAANSTMSAIGTNPWQLIYVFDGDTSTKVVCEGYSKAFQYLCDLTDFTDDTIACYCATGWFTGSTDGSGSYGPHMWNIVTIGGKNYLADITNCDGDPSSGSVTIGAPDKLFLVGMTVDSSNNLLYSKDYTAWNDAAYNVTYEYDKVQTGENTYCQDYLGTAIMTLSADDYTTESTEKTDISGAKLFTLNASGLTEILKYDGTLKTPAFRVTLDGKTLDPETDYELSGELTGTNAGNYTVTITGKGDYTGTATGTWTITNASAANWTCTTAPATITYTGNPLSPVITVKDGSTEIPKTEYTIDGVTEATDAGTYTFTITPSANYSETTPKAYTWTINKKQATLISPAAKNTTYNGEAQALVTAGTPNGGTMEYSLDGGKTWSADIPTATNAGDYTVTAMVKGDKNHTDSQTVSVNVTIAQKNISSVTITLDKDSYEYTGEAITPVVTVKDGETTLIKDTDYTLSGNLTATATGNYTITVTGKGNYTGEASKSYSVTKGTIVIDSAKIYNGDVGTGWSLLDGTLTLEEGYSFNVTISDDEKITEVINNGTIVDGDFGDAHLNNNGTITGGTFDIVDNNAGGTITGGTFAIIYCNGGSIVVENGSVTAENTIFDTLYSDKDCTVTIDGKEHTHTPVFKRCDDYTNTEHIIRYICNECSLNYQKTVYEAHSASTYSASGNKISAACVCGKDMGTIITLNAPADLTYDRTAKEVNLTNTTGEEVTVTYCHSGGCIDAGEHTASVTYGDATATTTFTIEKLAISGSNVTIGTKNFVYTGAKRIHSLAIDTITLTIDGEEYNIKGQLEVTDTTTEFVNVGTYTMTLKAPDDSNFTGTVTADWQITKADITTAVFGDGAEENSKEVVFTKEYDGTTAFNTSAIKGIKFGEAAYIFSGFTVAVDAADANVGENKTLKAVITLDNTMSGNFNKESYTVTVTGSITAIAPKYTPPTAKELTYNGEAQALVTAGESEHGTFWYSLTGDNYDTVIPTAKDAGTYTVYYHFVGDENHGDVSAKTMTVTIARCPVTVTATDAEKVYGDADPAFEITISKLCGTDTLTGKAEREAGEDAGTYAIKQGTYTNDNNPNYEITFVEGKLTIKKKPVTMFSIPMIPTAEYGTALSEIALNYADWKWVDDTIVPTVINDGYKIVRTLTDDHNYDYSSVKGYDADTHTVTITLSVFVTPAALTVAADDKYIIVGADIPEATYTVTGLVGEDTLTKEPTIGYSGADNKTIGTYEIVVSGAEASQNYKVTHKNGTLHVALCDHTGTTEIRYDSDSHWYYCTKCGADNLNDASHSGGTADCTKQAVCEICNIPYGKALGHSWAEAFGYNDTHHWHNCQNTSCPVTDNSGKDGYAAHSFGEWTVETAATETAAGVEKRTCECGAYETKTTPPTGSSGGGYTPPAATTTPAPATTTSADVTTTTPSYTGRPSWITTPAPVTTTTTTTTVTDTPTTLPPATDDDIIDGDIYEEDDSLAPQIKGENGKIGWNAISDEIADTEEGGSVVVDMNGSTEVPEEIFEQIMGLDIDIIIELENGFKWTINGESITKPVTFDLGVEFGSDIPIKIFNYITGEISCESITLSYEGEFGLTAVLTVDLGEKNEGYYANLYYYDGDAIEFICADKIGKKGKTDLKFTHASEYVIVIDEENHGKRAEESEDSDVNGNTDEVITEEDSDSNPFTAVTLSFTGVIISAAAVVLTKKRRK